MRDHAERAVSSRPKRLASPPTQGLSPHADARQGTLSQREVVRLQRQVGNRAVAEVMRSVVQRIPVDTGAQGETLYNQSTGGQAGGKHYNLRGRYEMTRDGDNGVTVTIKIKFLNQQRNTVEPPDPNPDNLPRVGQLIGDPTELPDDQRGWATSTADAAVAHWNGRLVFAGEEVNIFRGNTAKRLPVSFRAEPVFGLDEAAHHTVIVHPAGTVGGAAGHPIDAGNWYVEKDEQKYPAKPDIIYAHEYGHLLGIADEYSQSNTQMHLLMHGAAPATAPSTTAALDRITVERMALAALTRPMASQLTAALPPAIAAIRAMRSAVSRRMAAAAREGVVSEAVRTQLRNRLAGEAAPTISPNISQVVAFQTTNNFSNRDVARSNVESAFGSTALEAQIRTAYERAMLAPHRENVTAPLFGDIRINVQDSVRTAGTSPELSPATSALAEQTIGPANVGLPEIPPDSLVGRLGALPATWSAAGSALETGVTAEAFAARMHAVLASAAAAAAAAPAGAAAPAPIESVRALYQRAHELVNNAAGTAVRQLARGLVADSISPVLAESVRDLQASIAEQVHRMMSMSPSDLARAGPPDPNMAALVANMHGRLLIGKVGTMFGGRNPLGVAGASTPAQDVTYSYQGLMGSNASAALRADQFNPMVNEFNRRLTTSWERDFRPEVK